MARFPDKPRHLLNGPLSPADALHIWARDRYPPAPMTILRETMVTPSGGMLDREYVWQGWLYEEKTRGWDVDSMAYWPSVETFTTSSSGYNSGLTPWIREVGTAKGQLRVYRPERGRGME
jgi:hypothetical protein